MSKSISTILRGISALTLSIAGLTVFAGAASAAYYNSASADHIEMIGASDPTGSGSLTVSWLTPSSVTGSGITSYQVVTSASDSTAVAVCTTANAGPVGAVQSCTFTPTTALTSLYVRGVQSSGNLYSDRAYAAVATGNATVSDSSNPGSVALSAPAQAQAAIASVTPSNGLITVAFSGIAAADQYLATIAASKIVVYVGQTAVCTKTGPFTAATSSCTFSPAAAGLSLGISYGFTAKIYNAVGNTSLSGGTSATPVNTPSAPSAVTATKSATGSSVTVAWTAPSSNGGTANTYTVSTFDGKPIIGCEGITATTCTFSLYTAGHYSTIKYDSAPPNASAAYLDLPYNNIFIVTASTTTGAVDLTASGVSPILSLQAVPGAVASITSLVVDGTGTGAATWVAQAVDGTNGSNTKAETGYTVQLMSCTASYIASCSNTGSPVRVPAGVVTYTFTGLTNGTYYSFNVSGYNAVGSGPTSTLLTPVAAASAVAATSGMTATIASVTNSSLTMTWTSPTNAANSSVTGYRVDLYQCNGDVAFDNGGCSVVTLKTATATGNSYTFTGISAAANNYYTATVKAINASGNSTAVQATPAAAAATGRTNTLLIGGAPSAPTVTYSSSGVTFKWGLTATQFAAAQRLSTVASFTIYDNTTGTTLCTAAVSALSCTVAKLTAGDSIVIYDTDASGISSLTAAVTGFGTANASSVSVPTKVYNAKVTALTAVTDDAGNFYLSWTNADTNIGYFLITALGTDGTSFTLNAENRSAGGSLLNFAVIPASKITAAGYTFAVTPVNAVGTGAADAVGANNKVAASAATSVCSLADTAAGCALIPGFGPPAAPITVTSSATTSTITFTWSAPTTDYFTTAALSDETGYPAITGYTGTLTSAAGAVQTCSTTGTSCTFSGLTQGASYSFTVAANTALPGVVGLASTAVAAKANGVPSAPTIASVTNSAAGTPTGTTTLVAFAGPADPGAALTSVFTSVNNTLGDTKIYVSSTTGLAVGQALSGLGISAAPNNTIATITGSTNANCTLTTVAGPTYTLVNKAGSTACQNNAPVVGQLIVANTSGSTVLGQGDTIATVSPTYSSGWTITVTTPSGSSDTVVVGTGEAATLYGFVTMAGATTAPASSLAPVGGATTDATSLINVASTSGLVVGQAISNPTLITAGSTIASVVAGNTSACTVGTVTNSTHLVLLGSGCAALLLPGEALSFATTASTPVSHGTSLVSAHPSSLLVTLSAANSTVVAGDTVAISPYVTTTASVPVTTSLTGVGVINVTSITGLVAGTSISGASALPETIASVVAGNTACTVGTVTDSTHLVLLGSGCAALIVNGELLTFATTDATPVAHGASLISAGAGTSSVTLSAANSTVAVGDTVAISPYLTTSSTNATALTSSTVVKASGAGTALTSSSLLYTSGTGNASAYVGTATNTTTAVVTYCTSVLTSTSSSCVFATSSGSTYSFTMKAVNASGAGTASAASVFTTAYMSTAPTAVIAARNGVANEIDVKWTAPTLSNGAVVLSYVVTPYAGTIYTLAEQGTSSVCIDAVTGLSTITGTEALCDFSAANAGVVFKVYAITSAGNSQSSAASTAVAVLAAPASPTGVVTVTSATAGVTVNWVAVTGATSYTISAVGGLTAPLSVTSTTNSYTFTYTQITKGGSYTFRVKATNSVGSSSYVTAAAEVLADPTNAAIIVENTSNTTGNATGFYIYWTASAKASNGGQPVTYTVIGNGVGVTTLTATTTGTSVWIPVTGLTSTITALYSWTLSASDASGSSAGSPIAVTSVATNKAVPSIITYGATAGTDAVKTAIGTSAANTDTTEVLNATIPTDSTYVTYTVLDASGTAQSCALGNTVGGASSTSTTCILLGLTPGAAYSYSIVAGNGVTTSLAKTGYFVTAANVTSAPVVTGATAAVSALGTQSITVTWTAPALGASSVTSYIAYVDTAAADTTSSTPRSTNTYCTAVLTGTTLSCTIYGLGAIDGARTITAAGTYYVYVAAVNAAGVSAYGTLANAVTGAQTATTSAAAAAQPGTPTKVIVASAGYNSLSVSWTPAVNTGLPITQYTATATDATTGATSTCTVTTTSCVLTGITNGDTWTVAVYAYNAYASNPRSLIGTVYAGVSSLTWYGWSAPTIAPAITSVTSATGVSMAVTWAAPVFSSGTSGTVSAPLTGYTVVATDAKGNSFNCGALDATATTCTLTGLAPATSYTIVVTPSNAVGAGVAASITASTISSTVPGSPTGVTATAGFSTTYGDTATVAWTAPVSTGGAPITSYTATAKNTTTGAVVTCTITGAASALCAALVAGNSYAVTVTATNVVGASAASTPVVVAAFGNPPAVTGVTAIRNANGLQVSWTATATVFGATNSATAVPVLGYLVTATDNLSGQQYSCPYNATYGVLLAPAVTCAIAGLNVGNSYTVSVKAANLLSGLSAAATLITTYVALTPEPVMASFLAVTAKQKSVSALSPTTKTALSGLISTVSDGASITITGYGTTKAIAQARANAAANYLFNNGAAVHITIKTVVSKTVTTALVTVTSN